MIDGDGCFEVLITPELGATDQAKMGSVITMSPCLLT